MRKLLFGLLLAAIAWPQTASTPQPSNLELFLLIGQSNMAGRGTVEPQDKQPIPGVYALNKDLVWEPAIDPLHWDKPTAGVGIGRSFAKYLAHAAPGVSIGLIPAAVGGTSLNEWAPGDKLFTDAVRRARAAQKSGRLRGILWHQGEADSNKEALARTYRDRFTKFIAALREELNAPDVPVVVGELGQFLYDRKDGRYPYARWICEQQAAFPVNIPHIAFASSAGLGHREDLVHFDSPSLREFGRRYALAFLSLDAGWATAETASSK